MFRDTLRVISATFVFSLFVLSFNAQTTHWVRNILDNMPVDFTSLQTAISTANAGDTIVIYPSPSGYGNITIDKELHLIGLGYNTDLATQPTLEIQSTNPYNTSLGYIHINTAAAGSSVSSLKCTDINLYTVDNVTITRCRMNRLYVADCNHTIISGNYINSSTHNVVLGGTQYRFNAFFLNCNDLLVENNIFSYYNSNSIYRNLYVSQNSESILLKNNIFRDHLYIYNTTVRSNIFMANASYSGLMNNIHHNVFVSNILPDDNTSNVSESTLFVGWPSDNGYSFDDKFHLAPGSPAIGAASDGGNCGVYGSIHPYKLSGIHNRPLIYHFEADEEVPNGNDLNITIKVRTED